MIITRENITLLAQQAKIYADAPVFDFKGKFRVLKTDVTYLLSDGRELTIKSGFTHDEASIPWLLQPLFPKGGAHAYAALPHDALYYLTQTSRSFADNEYAYWMLALGVRPSQVRWRWWAVEKFGASWWNKNLKRPSERCIENRKFISIN